MESMRCWVGSLCWILAVAFGGAARADVVHLRNGRTLEGKIVGGTREELRLEVPGGSIVLPREVVARIERRASPTEEYARRARRVDPGDPRALEALAFWAAGRGLGEQALQLRAHARGLRLERRVARARRSGRARDFLAVHTWARRAGCSEIVQAWLLEQALARDPANAAALDALAALRPPPAPEPSEAEREQAALRAALERERSASAELRARLAEVERLEAEAEAARRARLLRRRRARRRRARLLLVTPSPRTPCDPPAPAVEAPKCDGASAGRPGCGGAVATQGRYPPREPSGARGALRAPSLSPPR
ncbi:MAG: hypothetical protein D6731_24965 [Planctomycetota bacterium]|nr:MAG: hypothetical protein D6731_24965 [Planctomycetota bacterium]